MTLFQRIALGFLVGTFLVGFLRARSLAQLEQQVRGEQAAQRQFLASLNLAAQDNQPLPPNPKPDTAGWLAAHALAGLDRRLISNSPSSGGAGAEIKLKNLKPQEVVQLLTKLTQVNLIIRRLVMADLGSRSLWEVQLLIEVPRPEAEKP